MNRTRTIPQTSSWSIPEKIRKSWDRKVPYYLRFRDHFAAEIAAGTLPAGSRLPPERVLAEQFSITRVTVRQALTRMEIEGLIFREERRGWFVSPPRVQYDPTANSSFTQSIAMQGRVAGTKVLSMQKGVASQWESAFLKCTPGDPTFEINRLRTVDGRPILVEQAHIKADRCPGLLEHPLDGSLTDVMAQEYGIIEQRVQITMRPTAISETAAKALGVALGTPGLYLMRTILDQYENVVEIDEEFWRHDAINICISAAGRFNGQLKNEHSREKTDG